MSAFPTQTTSLAPVSTGVDSRVRRYDTQPTPRLGVSESINQVNLATPIYGSRTASLLDQLSNSLVAVGNAYVTGRNIDERNAEQQRIDAERRQREQDRLEYRAKVEKNESDRAFDALGDRHRKQELPVFLEKIGKGTLIFEGKTPEDVDANVRNWLDERVKATGIQDTAYAAAYIDNLAPDLVNAVFNRSDIIKAEATKAAVSDFERNLATFSPAEIDAAETDMLKNPLLNKNILESATAKAMKDAVARDDPATASKLAARLGPTYSTDVLAANETLKRIDAEKQQKVDSDARDEIARNQIEVSNGKMLIGDYRMSVDAMSKRVVNGKKIDPNIIAPALRSADEMMFSVVKKNFDAQIQQEKDDADSKAANHLQQRSIQERIPLAQLESEDAELVPLSDGTKYKANTDKAIRLVVDRVMNGIAESNKDTPQNIEAEQLKWANEAGVKVQKYQRLSNVLETLAAYQLPADAKDVELPPLSKSQKEAIATLSKAQKMGFAGLLAKNASPKVAKMIENINIQLESMPPSESEDVALAAAANTAVRYNIGLNKFGPNVPDEITDADIENVAQDRNNLLPWNRTWSFNPFSGKWPGSSEPEGTSYEFPRGAFDTDPDELTNAGEFRGWVKNEAQLLYVSRVVPDKESAVKEAMKRVFESTAENNGYAFRIDKSKITGDIYQRRDTFDSIVNIAIDDYAAKYPTVRKDNLVLVPAGDIMTIMSKENGVLMTVPDGTNTNYTIDGLLRLHATKENAKSHEVLVNRIAESVKRARENGGNFMGGAGGKLQLNAIKQGEDTLRSLGLTDEQIKAKTSAKVMTAKEKEADDLKTRLMIISR